MKTKEERFGESFIPLGGLKIARGWKWKTLGLTVTDNGK